MSYIHLTIKEREMLMCLKAKGLTIRAIALRVSRSLCKLESLSV